MTSDTNININVSPANLGAATRLLASNFAGTVLAYRADAYGEYGIRAQGPTQTVTTRLVCGDAYGIRAREWVCTVFGDLPTSNDTISNGCTSLRRYTCGAVDVVVESGQYDAIHIVDSGAPWLTVLGEFDFGTTDDTYESIAEFDVDICPPKAAVDAKDVRIWVAYNYYQGALGAPSDKYLRDETSNRIRTFDSAQEAQAWIDTTERSPYWLCNGEAARPVYTIVE